MGSLAVALRDNKLPPGKVFVQVKLSVVRPDLAEELIPLISRFANNQNTVRASDFSANHSFHRRLEEISRRVPAPARDGSQLQTHWYYERARGQFLNDQAGLTAAQRMQFLRLNPKIQVITKTDVAIVATCFTLEPDTTCRGAEKAFTAFAQVVAKDWTDEKKRAEFTDGWFRAAVAQVIVFRAIERIVSGATWYQNGYRAQVVAYACARLAHLVGAVTKGCRLDFARIWSTQGIDEILFRQMETIGEAMMQVRRSPPREGQNVTEWAKQQACRESAMRHDVPVVDGFEAWAVGPDAVRSDRRERRASGTIDEELRAIQSVMAVPRSEWANLRDELRRRRLIVPQDEPALRAACGEGGRVPNEIQAIRLMTLL